MLTSQWIYEAQNGWSKLSGSDIEQAQIILVFGTGTYFINDSYKELSKKFPKSIIVGCSTSGTIAGQRVDDITVATLIYLEKGSVEIAYEDFMEAEESEDIGKNLALALNKKDLKHIFILSDGLHINGSELTQGFNKNLDNDVHVTGGLAGDGVNFEHTYVIANDSAKEKRVVAIGFYGDSLEITSGCFAGWDEFGAERLITKSKGNVLYEIDGKPALQLYKSYLADEADELPSSGLKFPISIRQSLSDKPLIRTLLGIDEEKQSLTFAGDVPEGHHCRLMKSNMDKLIDNAGLAAEHAKPSSQNADLCIAVSCVGRRIVLSQLVEEELDAIEEALGKDTLLAGFYSYGEIAPLEGLVNCTLHNQTMTLTVISEIV
ncbi:FIST C-terminal domain-containing protein [Sulfurimonas sp. MAG313]|nr:FIST N-terminal domain-containing protein [Sulfurimonas sp. MAG313]MDF1880954.1 FIST C-terminal domain-containing protein [Sulfurimonas sp. MAG313]